MSNFELGQIFTKIGDKCVTGGFPSITDFKFLCYGITIQPTVKNVKYSSQQWQYDYSLHVMCCNWSSVIVELFLGYRFCRIIIITWQKYENPLSLWFWQRAVIICYRLVCADDEEPPHAWRAPECISTQSSKLNLTNLNCTKYVRYFCKGLYTNKIKQNASNNNNWSLDLCRR